MKNPTRPNLIRPLAALLLGLAAQPAYARITPNPPPSGIVIHVFGPNAGTSHILPQSPQARTAAQAAPTIRATTPMVGNTAPAPASAGNPGLGSIAQQMFVTGDPAEEGAAALPKGKAGTR